MIDYNYTSEALSRKRNEAAAIYLRFMLLTPQYGNEAVYCFVEGYDMPYYRAMVRHTCRKEPVEIKCNGKSSVIAANKYIEEKEDCQKYIKLYFVDKDFDGNENLPDTIFITDGYSIENYYLSDRCVSAILDTEFKISQSEHPEKHTKCMKLFHQEHNKFFEGTLLLNAWYSCLYQEVEWSRSDVSLNDCFPSEWLNLRIGNITFCYSIEDIETKFNKAPIIDREIIWKRENELRKLGHKYTRGKYEMQFLFEFLSFLRNEPKKDRKYTVTSCSLPFNLKTMVSTFSQYADTTDGLYMYIKTGKRQRS